MIYTLNIKDTKFEGNYTISTKLISSLEYVVQVINVPGSKLLNGYKIDVSSDTDKIKITNESSCCSQFSVIIDLPKFITTPTPTPTPTGTNFPTLTPTPTRTPTPTPSVSTSPVPTPTPSSNIVITTIPQTWLSAMGLSTDSVSRDASLFIYRTEDVQLKVESLEGIPISGLSWNNEPWDNYSWNDGTVEYASPYSEVFRINPLSPGNGGLSPGTVYRFLFRRTSTPNFIFSKNIQIPFNSQPLTNVPM